MSRNTGENIAWAGSLTPQQSVDMWMSEAGECPSLVIGSDGRRLAAQYDWNAPAYSGGSQDLSYEGSL